MERIESVQNGRIKKVLSLQEKKGREELGLFLIEGSREIKRALAFGVEILEVYSQSEKELLAVDTERFLCSKQAFNKIAYREDFSGIVAVAKKRERKLSDLKVSESSFFVLIESVEKPGNLGAILRTCDGAGVDGVIVADPLVDLFNPNVIRSSVGAFFTVPVFQTTSAQALVFFKENKVKVVAATPHTDKVYTDIDYSGSIVIAVGREDTGLSDLWLSEQKVKIPMMGYVDSLNVSVAASLLMYEVVRFRGVK